MTEYKGHSHGEYDDECPICYLDREVERLLAENSRVRLLLELAIREDEPAVIDFARDLLREMNSVSTLQSKDDG